MTEIVLDVGAFMVWYALLITGIILLCLWATWRKKSAWPLLWGVSVSALIFYFNAQIAPLIFGVLNYGYSTNLVMFILTGAYTVLFFVIIAQVIYNFHMIGEAAQ